MPKHSILFAAALFALPAFAQNPTKSDKTFAAAVADPTRPATDTERDTNRKPVETLSPHRREAGRHRRRLCRGPGLFHAPVRRCRGAQRSCLRRRAERAVRLPQHRQGTAEIESWWRTADFARQLAQVAGECRAEIPRRRSFRARFVARCWRSPRRTSGRHAQPGGGKSLRDRKPFPERAGPRRKANIRSPACTTGCVRPGLPARRRKLSGANRCTQPRGSSVRAKLLR